MAIAGRWLRTVVRQLPRYYGTVRLPVIVHVGRTAAGVRQPDRRQSCDQPQDLPGSVQKSSCVCIGSSTPGAQWSLAKTRPLILPSADTRAWAQSIDNFRGSITELTHIPVNASHLPLPTAAHDSGPVWRANPSLRVMLQPTFLPA